MSSTAPAASSGNKLAQMTSHWPPLVYIGVGLFCVGIWLLGTAIQVQTSEAWMMNVPLTAFPTLAIFGQIIDVCKGTLPGNMVVPFSFGWGTQIALILASLGIELPKTPAWRYRLAIIATITLIAVNSAGDYNYSNGYGFWGQLAFTFVIFFMTFVVGILAIMCFMHAAAKMKS